MPRVRSIPDDAILERAIGVFWENAMPQTSAARSDAGDGLSSAALYHRFTDTDGLFVEALRRYADEGLVERLRVSPRSPIRSARSATSSTS